MTDDTGFLYLNVANEWPDFKLHTIVKAPHGGLSLMHTDVGFTRAGALLGGPFELHGSRTSWYRLRVYLDPLPLGTHIQLFTFTADDGDAPENLTADEPFKDPGWRPVARDINDILIPNPAAGRLWVGAVLRSEGQASPVLHQMRVDYGRDTYLSFLPSIYGEHEPARDFLERLLSLHASVLGTLEGAIEDLPRLFDPMSAPSGDFPSWLTWLSEWLGFDLNERWSDEQTREYLAQAFQLYGMRGTIEGLRRYLKIYAGVEARIEEPSRHAALWWLGETSTLGFSTMLAPADPEGAVLGASAVLDNSHLTDGEDAGSALFDDVAHRFCVQVYCADLTRPEALADVQAVLDREKPAHTVYHLCVIEPRMRVGAQAQVGIDTIIANGAPFAHIDMPLDVGVLGLSAEPCEKEEV